MGNIPSRLHKTFKLLPTIMLLFISFKLLPTICYYLFLCFLVFRCNCCWTLKYIEINSSMATMTIGCHVCHGNMAISLPFWKIYYTHWYFVGFYWIYVLWRKKFAECSVSNKEISLEKVCNKGRSFRSVFFRLQQICTSHNHKKHFFSLYCHIFWISTQIPTKGLIHRP